MVLFAILHLKDSLDIVSHIFEQRTPPLGLFLVRGWLWAGVLAMCSLIISTALFPAPQKQLHIISPLIEYAALIVIVLGVYHAVSTASSLRDFRLICALLFDLLPEADSLPVALDSVLLDARDACSLQERHFWEFSLGFLRAWASPVDLLLLVRYAQELLFLQGLFILLLRVLLPWLYLALSLPVLWFDLAISRIPSSPSLARLSTALVQPLSSFLLLLLAPSYPTWRLMHTPSIAPSHHLLFTSLGTFGSHQRGVALFSRGLAALLTGSLASWGFRYASDLVPPLPLALGGTGFWILCLGLIERERTWTGGPPH